MSSEDDDYVMEGARQAAARDSARTAHALESGYPVSDFYFYPDVDNIECSGSLDGDSDLSYESCTDDSDDDDVKVKVSSQGEINPGMGTALATASGSKIPGEPSAGSVQSSAAPPKCTCHALGEIYQDWCKRTQGRGSSPDAYFSSLLQHLAVVKSSFDMLSFSPASASNGSSIDPSPEGARAPSSSQASGGTPLCPVHGRPELPEKLTSQESPAREKTTPSSELPEKLTGQGGVVKEKVTPPSLSQNPPEVEGPSVEEQKAIDAANTKLLKVKNSMTELRKHNNKMGKKLNATVKWMDANKLKMEKAMVDHVTQLKARIDQQHKRARDAFNRDQEVYWHQILQAKLEVENFKSELASRDAELQRKFSQIKRDGSKATQDVPALCDKIRKTLSMKPNVKHVQWRPKYSLDVPKVQDKAIASLVGQFKITKDGASQPKPPPSSQAGDSKASSAGGNAKATGKGDAKQSVPSNAAQKPGASPNVSAPVKNKQVSVTASAPSVTPNGNSQKPAEAVSKPKPNAPVMQKADKASSAAGKDKDSHLTPTPATWASVVQATPAAKSAGIKTQTLTAAEAASLALREDMEALGMKLQSSLVFASSSSLASSASSASPTKKRRSRGKKKKKAGESVASTETPQKPQPVSVNVYPGSYPVCFQGRQKPASSLAPRADGKVWIVYGYSDPHLDLLDQHGQLEKSFRIGGNTKYAEYFDPEHVLVASHSPTSQLRMFDADGALTRTVGLEMVSTSLSVGCTGIVVSSPTTLYWIALDGGENRYIFSQADSYLKRVVSTAVIIYQGKELICAADKPAQTIYFYQKEAMGGFSPLPPFFGASANSSEQSFLPASITAHPKGLLAILNEGSGSVMILNMEQQRAVRDIPVSQICTGEPSVIAFGPDRSEECPTIWAASTTGGICLTDLVYEYDV